MGQELEGYTKEQLIEIIRSTSSQKATMAQQAKEIERLKEYEWMYKDLCK